MADGSVEEENLDIDDAPPPDEPQSYTVFYIAGGLSAVWLIVSLLLGWNASPDDAGDTFGGLTANEWGDFLAGVFAPIAFFGLAATLWIQSSELREQRRELALTRHEYKNQRKALRAQVLESRQQAASMKAQTQILIDQDMDRKTARQDDFLFEFVDNIVATIRTNSDWLRLTSPVGDFFPAFSRMTDRVQLENFGQRLHREVEGFFDNFVDSPTFSFTPKDPEGFLMVKAAFQHATEQVAGTSSMAMVRYHRYGIDLALTALEKIEKNTAFPPEF